MPPPSTPHARIGGRRGGVRGGRHCAHH
jgi:hypothetical protein